ncbi:hypothetical protein [Paenibacillus sp. FSL H7-0918]
MHDEKYAVTSNASEVSSTHTWLALSVKTWNLKLNLAFETPPCR